MAERKRQANIELLRIVAMVMIVLMHFLRESGSLPAADPYGRLTGTELFALLLEAFCIVAVNAYVFISGYFGATGSFKVSGVIGFLCRIWFYSLLIPVVLALFGVPVLLQETGIYGLASYLLPIETEHYWFATSYFFLLLLTPLLQAGVKQLSQRQLQIVLAGLLFFCCGMKSISPIAFAVDRYGYDVLWFVCVYLLAGYCRLYGFPFIKRHAVWVYTGSCFVIFAVTVVLWYLVKSFPGAAYYYSVPFHYNFVFALTGAMGLFFLFERLSVREGKGAELIRRVGRYSFGVYLLHEHLDIRKRWYPFLNGILNPSGRTGFGELLFELFSCLLLLFAAGLVIDCIRSLLFQRLSVLFRKTVLGKSVQRLEEAFDTEKTEIR